MLMPRRCRTKAKHAADRQQCEWAHLGAARVPAQNTGSSANRQASLLRIAAHAFCKARRIRSWLSSCRDCDRAACCCCHTPANPACCAVLHYVAGLLM
jgi:hypothetical protein